jgi:glycosyltransferase involved in cell wall biosynthesis
VGRLVYYKGVEFLIKAMTGLDATLLIVGAGPEERRLKKLVDRLNLNSKITFVGFVPNEDLPSYYRACDVFCLPSVVRSESFGIVQLEAMASSRPVVSTEIGTATSFVNRDGETGIIVPPRDEKALTSALKAILDDPILKRRLGEDARRRVVKYFDYRVIAGKFLDLYNKII